ncbi:MAG: hypothetical protein HQ592_17370 [Planctomycetes bacterium]|nr:hypothetical protein [Planctomycetota bacterium]
MATRTSSTSNWKKRLVYKVACPNCWHSFPPEEIFLIAKHPDLVGDPVVGSNEYLRFLPTRFTPKGEALDPRGVSTADLACPRCHLQINQVMLEVSPLFISIIGSPASGKSYFLTTMTWELRRMLPQFRFSFSDADPAANAAIHDYEQTLFLNPQPDKPTAIRKTQLDDARLHRFVRINDANVRLPVPLQFLLWPMETHPRHSESHRIGRAIVMYDNAGEDCQPGAEMADSAVVQHLAMSKILLVLFDLTQDPRFLAQTQSNDPQLRHGLRPELGTQNVVDRQETILREATVRLRKYLGISQEERLNKPLVIIVPKFDIWEELAGVSIDKEPYETIGEDGTTAMNTKLVEDVSSRIREVLLRFCPEFVATAENLSKVVRYIPVSSFGCSPEFIEQGETGFYGIRPENIKPKWVTVPLLYCLCKWAPGMIAKVDGNARHGEDAQ